MRTERGRSIERLRYSVDKEWRGPKTAKYMPVMPLHRPPDRRVSHEANSAVCAAKAAFPTSRDAQIPPRIQLMLRFKLPLDHGL